MDVELSLIAERFHSKLRYLRMEKNEQRTAHDFLERIVADAKKCFQRKTDDNFVIDEAAISALNEADALLVSWGNRGSHSYDVTSLEAMKLINSCEAALAFFKCVSCEKTSGLAIPVKQRYFSVDAAQFAGDTAKARTLEIINQGLI